MKHINCENLLLKRHILLLQLGIVGQQSRLSEPIFFHLRKVRVKKANFLKGDQASLDHLSLDRFELLLLQVALLGNLGDLALGSDLRGSMFS